MVHGLLTHFVFTGKRVYVLFFCKITSLWIFFNKTWLIEYLNEAYSITDQKLPARINNHPTVSFMKKSINSSRKFWNLWWTDQLKHLS